jgi:hypothetical protein
MIFVRMRQDDTDEFIAMRFDITEVRDRDIDAEQILVGEHHSAIHDDHLITIAEDCHIHSELAETAQGGDLEFSCNHFINISLSLLGH